MKKSRSENRRTHSVSCQKILSSPSVLVVLSPEGKDQINGEEEQSAYREAVSRSCTMSPNNPNMAMLKDRARPR
ncbi:hypothetical protein H5410_003446 [Solanum commersonii]|uniref:Uncharacterized protein n=1 Tax=Solanum commersonii TaxID=4109 RepID=A0A9J6B4W5_SOLCO|nr:hypothetical protein H5410_003446 [Solanum commersonii]